MAPNLRDLTGPSLSAKIIAHTGGIRRLALLPSSTVQILGAEKALFRHLKTGEKPPKHGLIYQHPDVRGSRWWIRGKVARALAGKISWPRVRIISPENMILQLKKDSKLNWKKSKNQILSLKERENQKRRKTGKKRKRKRINFGIIREITLTEL